MPNRQATQLWIDALLALTLATAWFAVPPARGLADTGDVVYVSATDNTCAGHKPCFTNLQDAVNAAPLASTVRVAAGTYTDPDTGTARYVVWIYKSIRLEGGWNLAFTQRDRAAYPTVLDAQGLGRVVQIYNPYEAIAPVVEGFVIQGGNATSADSLAICGSSGDCGGGILSANAAPLIANNVIAGNVAATSPQTWGKGGGVHIWDNSGRLSTVLQGNVIQNNVANLAQDGLDSYGGGVYVLGMNDVLLADNQILGNTAENGGGVYLDQSPGATFSGNLIADNNNGLWAGGLQLGYSDGSTFAGNTFSGNDGAGLLLQSSGLVHLEGNTFQGNAGCGAKVQGGDVTALDNIFTGNGTAGVGDEYALSMGGPALVEGNLVSGNNENGLQVSAGLGVTAVVRNNTIVDNLGRGLHISGQGVVQANLIARNSSPGWGGGIYLTEGDGAVLEGNTITGNEASWTGGGLNIQNSKSVAIRHNVVTGNVAGAGGGLAMTSGHGSTVSDNEFSGNEGGEGGGIWAASGYVEIRHNVVTGNHAASGGGVYLNRSGPLTNNDISNNQATDGGGVWATELCTLTGNRLAGNVAADRGGGLYWERGTGTFRRNTFWGNQATTGGAVYANLPTDTGVFEENTVLDNLASGDGGGIYVTFMGTLTLTNNILADNGAGVHGDQLYLFAWWPTLTASLRHNTFAHRALGDEAIFVGDNTDLTMANNMVVSHTVGLMAGGAGLRVVADHTFFALNGDNVRTNITSTYSVTSTGEVTGDPGFAGPSLGNYHLAPASDAMDAGVDAGVDTDVDGGFRPGGPGFDIGADEWFRRTLLPCIFRQL